MNNMKRVNVISQTEINGVKFGMDRCNVRKLLESDYEEFNKSTLSKNTTDSYDWCHVYYNENDEMIALEIIKDMDIYYNDTLLPKKYSQVLDFFKNMYDDIKEQTDGFISKKGSIGVYIENEDDRIDSILFGQKDYYNDILTKVKDNDKNSNFTEINKKELRNKYDYIIGIFVILLIFSFICFKFNYILSIILFIISWLILLMGSIFNKK